MSLPALAGLHIAQALGTACVSIPFLVIRILLISAQVLVQFAGSIYWHRNFSSFARVVRHLEAEVGIPHRVANKVILTCNNLRHRAFGSPCPFRAILTKNNPKEDDADLLRKRLALLEKQLMNVTKPRREKRRCIEDAVAQLGSQISLLQDRLDQKVFAIDAHFDAIRGELKRALAAPQANVKLVRALRSEIRAYRDDCQSHLQGGLNSIFDSLARHFPTNAAADLSQQHALQIQSKLIDDQNSTIGMLLKRPAPPGPPAPPSAGGGHHECKQEARIAESGPHRAEEAFTRANKIILELRAQSAAQHARAARLTELKENGRLIQSIHVPSGAPAEHFPVHDIFLRHAGAATSLVLVDPYFVSQYQCDNLLAFLLEVAARTHVRAAMVTTHSRSRVSEPALLDIASRAAEVGVQTSFSFVEDLHHRECQFSNSITVTCDRGLDIYKPPGATGRTCRACTLHVFEVAETFLATRSDAVALVVEKASVALQSSVVSQANQIAALLRAQPPADDAPAVADARLALFKAQLRHEVTKRHENSTHEDAVTEIVSAAMWCRACNVACAACKKCNGKCIDYPRFLEQIPALIKEYIGYGLLRPKLKDLDVWDARFAYDPVDAVCDEDLATFEAKVQLDCRCNRLDYCGDHEVQCTACTYYAGDASIDADGIQISPKDLYATLWHALRAWRRGARSALCPPALGGPPAECNDAASDHDVPPRTPVRPAALSAGAALPERVILRPASSDLFVLPDLPAFPFASASEERAPAAAPGPPLHLPFGAAAQGEDSPLACRAAKDDRAPGERVPTAAPGPPLHLPFGAAAQGKDSPLACRAATDDRTEALRASMDALIRIVDLERFRLRDAYDQLELKHGPLTDDDRDTIKRLTTELVHSLLKRCP